MILFRVSFKSTDKLQGVIPDWKWGINVHITLCREVHSFHGRWLGRTLNKEPWHTVHGLNSIHVITVSSMGPMFTQTPINGSKCCVMWVVVPVRLCGLVHSCCHLTVSTCLAIHLGLFLEWIPNHCASALLNWHYLQHKQPTLQVMRDCHQYHIPWKLCISRDTRWYKLLCSISSQESPPEVCR